MRTINVAFQIRNGLQTLTTAARYPNISRGWYKKVDEKDINHFKSFLLPDQVITDESIIEPYNTEWMKECKGSSSLLLRPHNTLEISKILQYCNMQKLAIVPQGGNTGLAHGSIPVFDEIILSMSKLNKVIYIDKLSGVLVCEAGCILKILDDALAEQGLIMPLDLAAKDSCQIGGNVATNAGGIRLIRYGSLRGSVLGLEMVLPDGRILDCLNTMRKDNTGYDLKNLFIGSEGTLGVITKVAIHCPPRPKETAVAFFGCQNYETVIKAYELAKSQLGETLSAFEFMDGESMRAVCEYYRLESPFKKIYPNYFLIQTASSASPNEGLSDKLVDLYTQISADKSSLKKESNDFIDGIIAMNVSEQTKLWKYRELIYPAYCDMHRDLLLKSQSGMQDSSASDYNLFASYDISLPINLWPTFMKELLEVAEKSLKDSKGYIDLRIGFCGHFGDQNIHVTAMTNPKMSNLLELGTNKTADLRIAIETHLYHNWPELYGTLCNVSNDSPLLAYSYSAEHGLGLIKNRELMLRKNFQSHSDSVKWQMMTQIKRSFDPNKIMNPYKLFGTAD